MTTTRQPKGRPTGGQFAPDEHAEAPVSLAGPPTPDFPGRARVRVDGRPGAVSGTPALDGSLFVNLDEGGCVVARPEDLEREPAGYRVRHPEWAHIAADLEEDGLTRTEARGVVAIGTTLEMANYHSKAARQLLASGDETNAALHTIALGSLQGLPGRLHVVKAGLPEMAERIAATRDRLKSNGAPLDDYARAGRQPVFAATDELLADLHGYLLEQDV